MAKTATAPDHLSKGDKVVARTALRDVAEGTGGRVILVNGFAWTRYWVRFDNGVSIGSLDRDVLATADEWKRFRAGDAGVFGAGAVDAGDGGSDEGEAATEGTAAGKATPSGTVVPQKLLDRATAARKRLGG